MKGHLSPSDRELFGMRRCCGRIGLVVASALASAVAMTAATPRITASAQTAVDAKSSFEVASVKPFKDYGGPRSEFSYKPDGVTCRGCTLAFVIAEAYGYPVGRLQGPESLTKESLWIPLRTAYDIDAKAGAPVTKRQLELMLQTLLRERFGLAMHHESKATSVYGLTIVKGGARLRESGAEEFSYSTSSDGFTFRNANIVRLVSFLSSRLDRPVVDQTGLTGTYNFVLKSADEQPSDSQAKTSDGISPDTPSAAAFEGSLEVLGLQLVKEKASIDYLVVDTVTAPTKN
jgi:uncharacterized protein (TIGR03435 family)